MTGPERGSGRSAERRARQRKPSSRYADVDPETLTRLAGARSEPAWCMAGRHLASRATIARLSESPGPYVCERCGETIVLFRD